MLKKLVWLGRAQEDLRAFPEAAQRKCGYQLFLVQLGMAPADYRPMPAVGPGVVEIRVHANGEFRIFYVARHAEAVFVLHTFEKKTRKTRQHDVDVARERLKEVRQWLDDRRQ